jgi:hypothetical protein
MWYLLQGGIFAGMFTFLRGACPDCAPSSASFLAVIAALVVTLVLTTLYELAVSVGGVIHRLRAKQGLDKSSIRTWPGLLGQRRSGTDHLAKFRHLPPH